MTRPPSNSPSSFKKSLRPTIKHISLMYRGSRSAWATTETPPATRSKSPSRPARRAAGLPRSATSSPESSWRAGNMAPAEELARAEAERLLSGDRKDQLAGIYHDYARRLLETGDPLIAPDPKAAYELLVQARELAESPRVRASLLYRHGSSQHGGVNPARAIENFQLYVREYPAGADRLSVRLPARRRPAEDQSASARPANLDRPRSRDRAHRGRRSLPRKSRRFAPIRSMSIASTYGIPNPPDDTSLNQGVAALRRFLSAYPSSPKAVRAAHQLAASYLARGKSTEALEAFTQFLRQDAIQLESAEARRDWAELAMDASFKIGAILQGQQKFAEAIAAWKGYLAKFPNGPQSADAQRAILDTQLLIAADHLSAIDVSPHARTAWTDFVGQNPLDRPRARASLPDRPELRTRKEV